MMEAQSPRIFASSNVVEWGTVEVLNWVVSLGGLEDVAQQFMAHKVDGRQLAAMDAKSMSALGIVGFSTRVRLNKHIKLLLKEARNSQGDVMVLRKSVSSPVTSPRCSLRSASASGPQLRRDPAVNVPDGLKRSRTMQHSFGDRLQRTPSDPVCSLISPEVFIDFVCRGRTVSQVMFARDSLEVDTMREWIISAFPEVVGKKFIFGSDNFPHGFQDSMQLRTAVAMYILCNGQSSPFTVYVGVVGDCEARREGAAECEPVCSATSEGIPDDALPVMIGRTLKAS